MPLDDLDDFLAMELGAPHLQTSKKVNSLEALVLSRVQETCPPENRSYELEPLPDSPKSNTDPLLELLDLLIPLINSLKMFLDKPEILIDKQMLSDQRSLLAEQLLALPEINSIDKPGIFAAIASCIDAVNSTKLEKRLMAQTRLETLSQALIRAKQEAQQEQLQALDSFLQQFT